MIAGALACTERQMAQGLERTLATSECAWVASTPATSRTRNTHVSAVQRSRRLVWQRFLVVKCTLGYKMKYTTTPEKPTSRGIN